MKKRIIILLAGFLLSFQDGNSQEQVMDTVSFEFTREKSMELVQDSYLFMYFLHPADTLATLDRFAEAVNRIVPIDNEKRAKIKEQALVSVRQQADKLDLDRQLRNLLIMPYWDHISLLGGRADDVIKANFTEDEYKLIFEKTASERRIAAFAYGALGIMIRQEAPGRLKPVNELPSGTAQTYLLNETLDYFGIK